MSIFDFTGKVALVTSGNGGISLGMARALVQSGADICIWGQNKEKRIGQKGRRKIGRFASKTATRAVDAVFESVTEDLQEDKVLKSGTICDINCKIRS